MPGTSEHHTGQAIDLIIQKDGKWINENDDLLKEVETFNKIHKVLKHFGFILRYPKGKEKITGYPYEPWHIRYIGESKAMEIGDLTLEEFVK
jgi:D-alanyl-D-alanine carboxypeptidase